MPPHLKPNQMNTQEKNKLIAEFMNFPTKELGGRLTDGALINICKYHTSWDWLMPVVEKIEYDYMYSVSPTWEHCVIQNAGENSEKLYIETDGQSKIEATYYAVVEFIKWYNENTKH